MPDEHGTPGAAGQGAPGAPDSGQGFDYEQAYGQLRPEYTRATQQLSQYEGLFAALHDPDPDVQAAAFEYLGLEPVTEEVPGPAQRPGQQADEGEWEDPLEKTVQELQATVAELRARGEQEDESRRSAELDDKRDEFIDLNLEVIEEQIGRKLSPQEDEVLGNLAIAMEDEDGVPDVMGAYARLYGEDGVLEINRSQWIESKTSAAQAPQLSSLPADKRPQTAQQRVDYIDRRWRDLEDQQ